MHQDSRIEEWNLACPLRNLSEKSPVIQEEYDVPTSDSEGTVFLRTLACTHQEQDASNYKSGAADKIFAEETRIGLTSCGALVKARPEISENDCVHHW